MASALKTMTHTKITLAQKYGLDDNDLRTLFIIRKNGVKKNAIKTYSKAIQSFLNAPESQGFCSFVQ